MEYTRLGNTGLKVSRICMGTLTFGDPSWRDWILPESESRPYFKFALEKGINFFDIADMYSKGMTEEIVGRLLNEMARRDEVVIATKVFFKMGDGPNDGGLSRKHILSAIDKSLQRLGMDYVDLYYIHRWDYETPIEETLETLDGLVKAGKVRYLGASSMFAWQFAKSLFTSDLHGWERFCVMQNHYNLVYREEEREMIPLCVDQGVGVVPWSPLARGFLAGNRRASNQGSTIRSRSDDWAINFYQRPNDFQILERVEQIAKEKGCSSSQIALAWILNKPAVSVPIIGASKANHLEEAIAALEIKLSSEEICFLEEIYEPRTIRGHG